MAVYLTYKTAWKGILLHSREANLQKFPLRALLFPLFPRPRRGTSRAEIDAYLNENDT